jgi:hypothetical protein
VSIGALPRRWTFPRISRNSIGRTLEYLETRGVPVVGYRTDNLPAFYTASSGFPVDYRADTPADIAAALQAKWEMGLSGGMVIANPIPAAHALDGDEIDAVIDDAIEEPRGEYRTRCQQRTPRGRDRQGFVSVAAAHFSIPCDIKLRMLPGQRDAKPDERQQRIR